MEPLTPSKGLKVAILTPPATTSEQSFEKASKDNSAISCEVAASIKYPAKASLVLTETAAGTTEQPSTAYLTPPPSPIHRTRFLENISVGQADIQNRQSLLDIDNEVHESTLLSTTSIITKLDIETWLCGATKSNAEKCRMFSELQPRQRKIAIRNQIDKLSSIDKQSKAFDFALTELAKLYSCHHHNKGYPLEERCKKWKEVLVPSNEIRSRIGALLWQISVKCSKCKNSIGGQKVQNCQRTSELLLDYDGGCMDYYLYLLRVWHTNSQCDQHSYQQKEEARSMALLTKIKAIVAPSTVSAAPSMSKLVQEFWPSAKLTSAFESIHQWEDPYSQTDFLSILKFRIKDRLATEDHKRGTVYIYKVDGNPTLLKIGFTTGVLESRRKQWQFDCNRDCQMIYHRQVRNAKRVEAICHADLHAQRVQVYCDGCLKNHNEWFRLPLERAREVVDKWVTWMESDPYDVRSLRSGSFGFLKDVAKLIDMEAFKRDPMLEVKDEA